MSPAKTKAKKEAAPELTLDSELSIEAQVLEKYAEWSPEQLEESWRDAAARLREVEDKVANADELLNEAAKRDAEQFATAGPEAWLEASNFRHVDKAQKEIAHLLVAQWGLRKLASELEYGFRLVKDKELQAEVEGRAPEVAEAEEAFREAEKRLNELRWQQQDVAQERRVLRDGIVHVRDRLEQALQGPGFRSGGR